MRRVSPSFNDSYKASWGHCIVKSRRSCSLWIWRRACRYGAYFLMRNGQLHRWSVSVSLPALMLSILISRFHTIRPSIFARPAEEWSIMLWMPRISKASFISRSSQFLIDYHDGEIGAVDGRADTYHGHSIHLAFASLTTSYEGECRSTCPLQVSKGLSTSSI